MNRFHKVKMFKWNKGFTLVELMVVIGIITILSAVILANYRAGERQNILQRAANKLAQDIRRTQEMAMSAKKCAPPPASCPSGGGVPQGGYGIYFNKNETKSYKIYADNGDEKYNVGEEIETINLEKGAVIEGFIPSSANFSINFKPPDPVVKIKDQAGQDKTAVDITVSLESDSSKTKTVKVNEAGLIYVE